MMVNICRFLLIYGFMWVDKYIFCLSICLKFRHPIFGFRCFYFNNIIGSGLILGNVVLGVVSLIDGFLQLVSFEISLGFCRNHYRDCVLVWRKEESFDAYYISIGLATMTNKGINDRLYFDNDLFNGRNWCWRS